MSSASSTRNTPADGSARNQYGWLNGCWRAGLDGGANRGLAGCNSTGCRERGTWIADSHPADRTGDCTVAVWRKVMPRGNDFGS